MEIFSKFDDKSNHKIMRNIFSSGLFWGLLLILLGVLFFANDYLEVNVNIFRVFAGISLVIIGIWLVNTFRGVGYQQTERESTTLFSEADMHYIPGQQKYSVVFGSSHVDLTKLDSTKDKLIELSCVFGELFVKLNPDSNFEIVSNAAFASIKMPDFRKTPGMGSSSFNSPALDRSKAFTTLKIDAVFGETRFMY